MTEEQSASPVTSRRWSTDAIIAIVLVVLACSATIAVLVTRIGRDYFPLGDEASVDLRVRDVFTSNTPLVGAYSRDFNHPGPLFFWLLGPLSWVAGRAPWATLVGGAVLQGSAIRGVGLARVPSRWRAPDRPRPRRPRARVLGVRRRSAVPPSVEPLRRVPVLHAVPAADLVVCDRVALERARRGGGRELPRATARQLPPARAHSRRVVRARRGGRRSARHSARDTPTNRGGRPSCCGAACSCCCG